MGTDADWLAGLEEAARERLPRPVYEYVVQGAGDGATAAAAVGAWSSVGFLPRVLRDVTEVDPGVRLLGHPSPMPWGIAPTTLQRAVHPDGELAVARATESVGGLMVVSSNAGTRFAEIAETGVHWWLQAYLPDDRAIAEPLLDGAVAAGAAAVVLTLDAPVVATKRAAGREVWADVDPAWVRVNVEAGYVDQPGAAKARDIGPGDIAWLAERTRLPVVVKGVLRPDDARRCVEAGAQAVWVSNHGGRQLDRAVSTVEALPAVVDAIAGRAEVYVDGGIRSGLDVLAGLSLGADAVFLGRLPLYALAAGEAGVRRMHEELRVQTVEALRLAGCRTVAETREILAAPPRGGSDPHG